MSLVEAIISVAIFSIGIAGFTMLFSKTWQQNSYVYEMGKASLSSSQGISMITSYVRKSRQGDDGAYPIRLAAENELIFFSDYDKDGITERLHFYRNGNQLLMGYRKPSSGLPKSYADGDEDAVVIIENVVNGANEPIFRYYDRNYPNSAALAVPVSVWNVRLIQAMVKTNIEKGVATDSVELRSFVELRNLNDYNRLTS